MLHRSPGRERRPNRPPGYVTSVARAAGRVGLRRPVGYAQGAPSSPAGAPMDRRQFLHATAATAGGLALVPRPGAAAPAPSSPPETAVKALYDSLTPAQRTVVCFPWDHTDARGLLRTHVSNNWQVDRADHHRRRLLHHEAAGHRPRHLFRAHQPGVGRAVPHAAHGRLGGGPVGGPPVPRPVRPTGHRHIRVRPHRPPPNPPGRRQHGPPRRLRRADLLRPRGPGVHREKGPPGERFLAAGRGRQPRLPDARRPPAENGPWRTRARPRRRSPSGGRNWPRPPACGRPT